MRDIADNMGFEVTNIYNYVENKQAMLSEVIFKMANDFSKGICDINNASFDTVDKLKAIISLHVRLSSERPLEVALLANDYRSLAQAEKYIFLKKILSYQQTIASIIQKGIATKQLNEIDTSFSAQAFLSSLSWLHCAFIRKGKQSTNPIELEIQVSKLIFNGLKP